jgi:3-oxoacyl-[acyl-carrier protein] reductase
MTRPRPDARVALITGGSRGLGAILCDTFLHDGWAVATVSRAATDFVTQSEAEWPETFYWQQADMTDPAQTRTVAGAVVSRYGRIDALVNNMGSLRQELFLTIAPDAARDQIQTNLIGPLFTSQACARIMVGQGEGCILNISSINALRGHSGVAAYSAAKAGLDGLTRSLARELGPHRIRVNSLVPGFFESELSAGVTDANKDRILRRTPLRRLGTPADVVDAARFMISERASFITGQTLTIDGGLTC